MTSAQPNPAAMLRHTLVGAHEGALDHDRPAARVWAEHYGVEVDSPELGRRLAGLVALAGQLRRVVRDRSVSNADMIDRRVGDVESSLVRINENWRVYWDRLGGQGLLDVLEITTAFLDLSDPHGLRVNDVESLRSTIVNLIAGVEDADDIDNVDKEVVTRLLRRIVEFLDRSEWTSTDELVDVAGGAAAIVLGNEPLVSRLVKSSSGQAVVAALVAFKLFTGGDAGNPPPLPPAPDIVVQVESRCYSMPALEAGDIPRGELKPAESEPKRDTGSP